jgi:hypothetical protein
MTPGQAFLVYFVLAFIAGELLLFLATRRDREGMPSGAHPWIAVMAALFAAAFAF